jgi:hypothetical protein
MLGGLGRGKTARLNEMVYSCEEGLWQGRWSRCSREALDGVGVGEGEWGGARKGERCTEVKQSANEKDHFWNLGNQVEAEGGAMSFI